MIIMAENNDEFDYNDDNDDNDGANDDNDKERRVTLKKWLVRLCNSSHYTLEITFSSRLC